MKTLITILLLYLFYRFLFGFVIPLFTATRQMKNKMEDLHRKMQEGATNSPYNAPVNDPRSTKVPQEDYIDYEEVKEK